MSIFSKIWDKYIDPIDQHKAVATKLDPNAYQYGGHVGGAADEQARLQADAQMADQRQGPNIYSQDYGADRGMEMGARGQQGYALQQLQGLANGTGPSLAAMQMQQAQQAAMNQQASLAASARGGGANLAAAQRAAAMGGANAMGQIANATGQARVQEQLGAINAYGGLAGQMRAGDAQRTGLSGQMGQQQGAMDLQSRNMNDQRNQFMNQLGFNVGQTQLQAQMARQQQQSANEQAAQGLQAQTSAANTGTRKQILGSIANSFGGQLTGQRNTNSTGMPVATSDVK